MKLGVSTCMHVQGSSLVRNDLCAVGPACTLGQWACFIFMWIQGWEQKKWGAFWVLCVENGAKVSALG